MKTDLCHLGRIRPGERLILQLLFSPSKIRPKEDGMKSTIDLGLSKHLDRWNDGRIKEIWVAKETSFPPTTSNSARRRIKADKME
jgi:hypothetical protein